MQLRANTTAATIRSSANARVALSWLVANSPLLAFTLLTALAAQVKIPVPGTDVPVTLQSLAVLLAGLLLTPAASATAMTLYLACGAAGLPVFSPGSQGLMGPSGGYIVGFVAAAWMIARLRGGSTASAVRLVSAASCGMSVLFALGVGWRAVWAFATGIDPGSAMLTGFVPFVPKALVEISLAVSLVTATRGFRGRWASRTR